MMSTTSSESRIRVCSLDELRQRGCIVVRGADRPIAVFYNDGQVRAVDNRCPHMGFPLHKGTLRDGMLTCHWHHARFDAASGCTFDLFADDVPVFDVEIRGQEVLVSSRPRARDVISHARRRLQEGMEQDIGLICAKAILALRGAGVEWREIIREAALFGAQYRDGWAMGMQILTAMANLVPCLSEETAYLALYQGVTHVAEDCDGEAPRRDRHPLESREVDLDTLLRWLRYWTLVRHRDGAERTVLTAIQNRSSREELNRLIFTAATDRFYADTGHALDFCNKAFELLDLIGWDHASKILPTVLGTLVRARGAEELNSWRHPIDLVPLVRNVEQQLPELFAQGEGKSWRDEAGLAEQVLGEDPSAILEAIAQAIQRGATAEQLGKSLAFAAALRIARFGTANELSDWIVALHTFSYCNALHQAIKRSPDANLVRGVLHGAMKVYLDRFLNIPPAKLPTEKGTLGSEPRQAQELLSQLLETLNTQQQVDKAARLVARYALLGHPEEPLLDTLTLAVVREDADFHTFQMLEAGIRQYQEWGPCPEGLNILIAVARYLAAHSPTQRARHQTARIALRLHRGEAVYEEDEDNALVQAPHGH